MTDSTNAMELYGKAPPAQTAAPTGGGANWLHFFRSSKNLADDMTDALGKCYLGQPIVQTCDEDFVSVADASYVILGDPYYYWATTLKGPPLDVFLEPRAGKFDDLAVKEKAVGIMLILPGEKDGATLPPELAPAIPVVYEAGSWTTMDLFTRHLKKIRQKADSPAVLAKVPGDIPPAFRLTSSFRVTTKPSARVDPYAVVKPATRAIQPHQAAALQAFFNDPTRLAEVQACERIKASKIAELEALADETAEKAEELDSE